MVANLELILRNVSSSYKILVKFLGGLSAHAQVLLLQNQEDSGIQTYRNQSQDHDLALGSEKKSTGPNQAEKFTLNIGHVL